MSELRILIGRVAVCGLLWHSGGAARAGDEPKLDDFLSRIASEDIEVRYQARLEAPKLGAAAVAPLGKLMAGDRRDVAISARAALERLVHHAGRPGAEAERGLVAAELARLLAPEAPAAVKRETLHLIAFIGGDAIVPTIAKLLDDPDRHVREAARLSLERLPGLAAARTLMEAAERGPEDRTPDLLFSLGKKGEAAAVPFLLKQAEAKQGKVRFAALEALARLGAPEAAPQFERAVTEDDAAIDRGMVFKEYLRLADNLDAGGKQNEARKIYLQTLARAPLEHERERALLRLAPAGSAEAVEPLLTALADPGERVRKLALARLALVKQAGITDLLRKAYRESKNDVKPSILTALAERDRQAAKDLLEEAAGSSDPELKIVALDLEERLDDPELEALYLKVAQDGSPRVKPIAMKGCLIVARRLAGEKKQERALSLYRNTLKLATDDSARSEALQGLEGLGDPRAMEAVAPFLKHPVLANEAARVYIIFAAKAGAAGDKEEAAAHLMEIVTGDFSRDLKSQAAGEMRKLGRDPQRAVRDQGFVLDWWLVGPIEDPDGKGLEQKFFPEEAIDLVHEQNIGARRFRWKKLEEVNLEGAIDLVPIMRRAERRIAYAYTELNAPAAREVLFKMGSDDGIACWLNGERIHFNPASRDLKVDQDTVKAKLRAGKNKILLKISNLVASWGFSFRITDPEGKPLVLRTAN